MRPTHLFLALSAALLLGPLSSISKEPTTAPPSPAVVSSVTPQATTKRPYTVTRIAREGPVTGVLVKVDLTDPRVALRVALVDDRDPDADGPAVGRLDTTTSAARKFDFDITLNASFFAAPVARDFNGRPYRYFVGNGAYPVGWHVSEGKVVTKPTNEKVRATMVIDKQGKVSLHEKLMELPTDTVSAISGNAMILKDGAMPRGLQRGRAPTSCVALSEDGKTLFLIAIDGRQEGVSRGVSFDELVVLLKDLGAHNAINFDGGGSTTMVLKDPATGVHVIANRPSDPSVLEIPLGVERPVVDVIGVSIRP